jgi:LacI family transcriptional regulator
MPDSAIDVLLRSIRRKEGDARKVIDHVVPHQLVKRDSVAPPGKH